MKLLITGASGLYGSQLAKLAQENGYKVYSIYNEHPPRFGIPTRINISDKTQVEKIFKDLQPEIIVHAATLTDVDKCELNRELAWQINVRGTENVALASKANNAFLLYVSTDYVFSGEKGLYEESDSPNPLNFYGLTKLKAEEIVKSLLTNFCIARPSVIYGATPAAGKINFALWILNNLRKGEKIKVLIDQWNSPTLNTSLARMSLEIIEKRLTGVFHLSGATRISRYDFAQLVAQTFNVDESLIIPSSVKDFSWIAPRPRDSSLNTAKAQQFLKNKPFTIKQALQQMKHEFNGPLSTI